MLDDMHMTLFRVRDGFISARVGKTGRKWEKVGNSG